MTLRRGKLDQESYATADAIPSAGRDLDLAVKHNQPRSLVNLVVGEALTGRQIEHDRACGIARRENFRKPWLEIKRPEVPVIHSVSFRLAFTVSVAD